MDDARNDVVVQASNTANGVLTCKLDECSVVTCIVYFCTEMEYHVLKCRNMLGRKSVVSSRSVLIC